MDQNKLYMYVSQWAFKLGVPGMSLFAFDKETGELEYLQQLNDNCSFGCSMVDQERALLYVCNEEDVFPKTPYNTGRVYCYRIDPKSGATELVNHQDTYCSFTSYLNTDPEKKYMMVSNHSMPNFSTTVTRDTDGNIKPVLQHQDALMNLFELNEDGSIGTMVDYAKHQSDALLYTLEGKPTIAHPHCVMRSPSGKLYACCDKGDSHIYLYTIDNGKLKRLSRTLTDVPGSEPRYCAFHPEKPYLYVNHEHTPGDRITLTTFRYEEDGTLEKIGTLYADLSGFEPKEAPRQQQGMCITPDGRFVYTQAHGYNLLLTLAVNPETGLLKQIQATQIEGTWPRSLNMTPDGNFLINCCLGGQISVYRVGEDGILTDTGHRGFAKGSGYVSFFDPNA